MVRGDASDLERADLQNFIVVYEQTPEVSQIRRRLRPVSLLLTTLAVCGFCQAYLVKKAKAKDITIIVVSGALSMNPELFTIAPDTGITTIIKIKNHDDAHHSTLESPVCPSSHLCSRVALNDGRAPTLYEHPSAHSHGKSSSCQQTGHSRATARRRTDL